MDCCYKGNLTRSRDYFLSGSLFSYFESSRVIDPQTTTGLQKIRKAYHHLKNNLCKVEWIIQHISLATGCSNFVVILLVGPIKI